jgi:hypothetical protein
MKIFNLYSSFFEPRKKEKGRGEIQTNSLYSKEYQMCDPLLHKPENSLSIQLTSIGGSQGWGTHPQTSTKEGNWSEKQ